MAKISKVVKNERRREMASRYAQRRQALKKIISNPNSAPEQVDEAVMKLQKMPRLMLRSNRHMMATQSFQQ